MLPINEKIIKKSFNFSVWLISYFHDMQVYEEKMNQLRKLPEGSLGKDIASCLDMHKLRLVPKFESHDLKHVLLDYKMTPVDEIRMQAFMLGNGNYSIACFSILIFGMILLPNKWGILFKDYKKGKNTKPISSLSIHEYAEQQTIYLRQEITSPIYQKQSNITMEIFIKYSALASVFAGIFGMLFCLPFLFSLSTADLIGAGFPFVGGSVLTVGGLFTLSNLSKPKTANLA